MDKVRIIFNFLGKALSVFWKFMIKPNKKNKVSKWKFILLGVGLIYVYTSVTNYINRPIVATKGAKTVSFTVNGDYAEGSDIQSGTYYVIVTKLDDTEKSVEVTGEHNISRFIWEFLKYGEPKRVSIPKNSVLNIESSDSNFEITFYTEQEFKDKNIQEKYAKSKEKISSSSHSETSTAQESTATSNSSESSSTSKPSSSTQPTTDSNTETQTTTPNSPVLMDVNEFTSRFDKGELEYNVTYQVTAELTEHELWGKNASGDYYNIYILGADPDGNVGSFILRTSEHIANSLEELSQATLTLKVRQDDFVYVTSVVSN